MSAVHAPVGEQNEGQWRVSGVTRLHCTCGWRTMEGWHLGALRKMLATHIEEESHAA